MSKSPKGLAGASGRRYDPPVPKAFDPCALVPAYQRGDDGRRRGRGARADPSTASLVVDDGSTDGTASRRGAAGAEVLRLPANGGKGDGDPGGPRADPRVATRRTSRSSTPTGSTTRPTCRGPARSGARGRRFRHRLADGGSGRDPALPVPDQRDRQPGPVADDGPRGRGRAVRLSRRRRGPAAPARAERARIHHRDRDAAEGLARTCGGSATCPCGRSTAGRRTTGRFGTRGSFRGGRCTTRCSRWIRSGRR